MSGRGRRQAFRRNRKGASALEFALVAPLLIGIILVLVQLSLWLYSSHVLNEALAVGARALFFDIEDTAGAIEAVQGAALERYLDTKSLTVTVAELSSPFPHLELKAVYAFAGIGVALPIGPIDMVATTAVPLTD